MQRFLLYSKRIISIMMVMLIVVSACITVTADDNESYDLIYTGIAEIGMPHDGLSTALQNLQDSELNVTSAYCVDLETEIVKNSKYSRCDVESSQYFSPDDAAHLRAIVRNSYPFISIDELARRSQINGLRSTHAITATQLAIWHYSNGIEFSPFSLYEQKIERLYNWLLSLEPIYTPDCKIANIDIKHSVSQSGSHAKLDISYKADSTNADGSTIPLDYIIDKDIESIYNASINPTFVDDEGYTHLLIENLPTDFNFNFNAYGTQNVDFDAYFYSPMGGRDKSQSLIGAYMGNTNISNNVDISYNLPNPGRLIIHKLDDVSSEGIEGVVFEVSDTQDFSNIPYTAQTDSDGIAIIDELTPGLWYIRESKSHEGYIPMQEIYSIEIGSYDTEITLKNTPYGGINIIKVDDDSDPIEGVYFDLYNGQEVREDTLLYKNLITNDAGVININNLTQGQYCAVETYAPKGYHVCSDPVIINVLPGEISKIRLTNNKVKPVVIKINDRDIADNSRLSGAVFYIYSDEQLSNKVAELTSRSDDAAAIENLPAGDYFVKKQSSPDRYIFKDEMQKIYLNEGESGELTFYEERNIPTTSAINIYNHDAQTNEQLSGGVFGVYSDENFENLIAELTGSPSDAATIANLPTGTYYIKQLKAPDGYLLDSAPQKIELSEGEARNLYFYNTKDYPTSGNFAVTLFLGVSIIVAGGLSLLIVLRKYNEN